MRMTLLMHQPYRNNIKQEIKSKLTLHCHVGSKTHPAATAKRPIPLLAHVHAGVLLFLLRRLELIRTQPTVRHESVRIREDPFISVQAAREGNDVRAWRDIRVRADCRRRVRRRHPRVWGGRVGAQP